MPSSFPNLNGKELVDVKFDELVLWAAGDHLERVTTGKTWKDAIYQAVWVSNCWGRADAERMHAHAIKKLREEIVDELKSIVSQHASRNFDPFEDAEITQRGGNPAEYSARQDGRDDVIDSLENYITGLEAK